MHFQIQIKPAAMNNAYSTGRNGRRFLSKEGKEYKEALGWAAREVGAKLYKHPEMTLIFTYGDKRRRDIDSAIKLTLDAFTGILYEDDSLIEALHVRKRYDEKNPSVEVFIQEAL